MASYGWRQVLDNIHTLPEVHGFEPAEWINMLTTNERAQLAAHVAQYSSADRAMLDIDTSRSASSVTPAEADVVANVVAARAALDDVVCVLVAQVKSALSDNYPVPWEPGKQFDPGGAQLCHHDILSCTAESSSGLPIQRRRIKRRKCVDICSGHQSLAKYLLALDAGAEILSIDILPRCEALREVPAHLHFRIKYVEFDAAKLTLSELRRLVREHLNCELADLYCLHFSLDCRTYSSADAGLSAYRRADGTPNSSCRDVFGNLRPDRYALACMWDEIVALVVQACERTCHV